MRKASRQLDEIAEFFGTLGEADLRKPCPDRAGDTVGAAAAHMAEGYHYLGRFLQAAGYVPGPPGTGHIHGRGPAPGLSDMLDRLPGGRIPIGLLADLTDEQLDSVPPAGSGRFSDGCRTLEQAIDAVIAHQAVHLVTLKRAVA
jgi:hypothetical protein